MFAASRLFSMPGAATSAALGQGYALAFANSPAFTGSLSMYLFGK
jgi:hypothetical protein